MVEARRHVVERAWLTLVLRVAYLDLPAPRITWIVAAHRDECPDMMLPGTSWQKG